MAKGDIVEIVLPNQNGHEQHGLRPCIAVNAKDNIKSDMSIIVPITTTMASLNFEHSFEIEPSKQNGLKEKSVALVIQMRSVDNERINRKLGRLEDKYLKILDEEIKKMLGF